MKRDTLIAQKTIKGENMKIQNMTNGNGNKVANQFIIFDSEYTAFQSYDSVIVKTVFEDGKRQVYLDEKYWNYSKTTSKYRNQFLGETTKETERKIKDGTYKLADLNG
jgi:hypothetical protein